MTVYGINACGNGQTGILAVTVNPIPATPIATAVSGSATSNVASGNQWYFSATAVGIGVPVNGATAQSYTPTLTNETGWYWTTVTTIGCSSAISNKIYIQVLGTGVYNAKMNGSFIVYPIPNDGNFTATITIPDQQQFTIQIYNKVGQRIFEQKDVVVNREFKQKISLGAIPDGMYSLIFTNKFGQIVQKILVFK